MRRARRRSGSPGRGVDRRSRLCRVAQARRSSQPRIDPVNSAPHPGEPLPEGQWLPVDRGHRVWWCEGGDPSGLPVLIVHGGPGGRSRPEPGRWFAGLPVRWLAIDQRGCGRSTPLGETAGHRFDDLLDDMERLRRQLGLAGWALAGGSWGARLALAYAAACPDQVQGLMLRSPFLGSAAETRRYIASWHDWLGPAGRDWLGSAGTDAVFDLYHNETLPGQTVTPDRTAALADAQVARAWSAYDDAQSAPGGVAASGARWSVAGLPADDAALQAGWRVHAHHAQRGWGEADGVPRGAPPRPASGWGPVSLVWGRDDATCDPAAARALAAALPDAVACEVPGAGHRMSDPRLQPALGAAARDWVAALQGAAAPAP